MVPQGAKISKVPLNPSNGWQLLLAVLTVAGGCHIHVGDNIRASETVTAANNLQAADTHHKSNGNPQELQTCVCQRNQMSHNTHNLDATTYMPTLIIG
jgi:hypothetical protein